MSGGKNAGAIVGVVEETITDFLGRSDRMLGVVAGPDRETVVRTHRRLGEVYGALAALVNAPAQGRDETEARHQASVQALVNTLESIAARYGFVAAHEAREFLIALGVRLATAALLAV